MIKQINIIIAFLICGASFAQRTTQIEIIAGPTISKIIGKDLESVDFIFGIHGGLMLNIPRQSGSMRIGALYNQKGFEADDIEITLNYLTVPAHFGIATSSDAQFYIGPELNFLLNANASDGNVTVDIDEGLNDVDISVAGGILFPVSDRVNISFGFSFGMIKVLKIENYESSHIGQNLSIPFNVGLRL